MSIAAAAGPYILLDAACRRLAHDDDPAAALEALRGLTRLGLGGPARELLRDGRLDTAGVDVAALRRCVAQLPTGRVPWERCAGTLQRNLQALMRGRPHLEVLESDIRGALRTHELYRSLDGQMHLSTRPTDGTRRWVPGLVDWGPIASMEIPVGPSGPPAAVTGLGLNGLVERVCDATRGAEGLQQQPVYIIEPDPACLAAWLAAEDRRPVLCQERVHVFAGPGAHADLERFLEENEDLLPPGASLFGPGWADAAHRTEQVARCVVARREAALASFVELHRCRAAGRTTTAWAARLGPGATILGVTSRFTTMLRYSMRDIGEALEALGYTFRMLVEASDHRCHTTLTTSRAVCESDPALVILINHLRREHPVSFGEVPILTWVQDPVPELLCAEAGDSIGPHDFVCGFYAERCVRDLGYPARRFFPVPFFPVSARRFHEGPLPPGSAERYAADLAYVGHYHGSVREICDEARRGLPEKLRPVLDAISCEVLKRVAQGRHVGASEAAAIVDAAAAEAGARLPPALAAHLANFFAYRIFDIHFRLETLGWAAQWARRRGRRLRLYGRGWERHPELRPFAAGPVEHGVESRLACRGAALSIQTIPVGLCHQRTFEALLSGSLVLARYSPDNFAGLSVEEFRTWCGEGSPACGSLYAYEFRGLHRVTFRHAAEFGLLADRYLEDRVERESLREEMAALVRRHLTYETVVPSLVDAVRCGLRGGKVESSVVLNAPAHRTRAHGKDGGLHAADGDRGDR
jgi:hypothetical protein